MSEDQAKVILIKGIKNNPNHVTISIVRKTKYRVKIAALGNIFTLIRHVLFQTTKFVVICYSLERTDTP